MLSSGGFGASQSSGDFLVALTLNNAHEHGISLLV
jgi:hypothetical protein